VDVVLVVLAALRNDILHLVEETLVLTIYLVLALYTQKSRVTQMQEKSFSL
jgi:hypothetical protein